MSVFKDFLIAASTAIFVGTINILMPYFTFSGGVDYSVSEDANNYYISVVINNNSPDQVNIEIGMNIGIDGVVSNTGISGIEILNPTGRAGSILVIGKVPPTSEYVAIVKGTKGAVSPSPILVSAPRGMALRRADPTRGNINVYQIAANSAVYTIIYFVFLVAINYYSRKNRRALSGEIEDSKNTAARLGDELKNITIRLQRMKLLFSSQARHLRSENEFWRHIFERIIVTDGVSKGKAMALLSIISQKFGYKRSSNVADDVDLEFIIDVMLDEEKRKRFEELGR